MEPGQRIVSTSPYGFAGQEGTALRIIKFQHDAFEKGTEEPTHRVMLDDLSQPFLYPPARATGNP